MLKIAPSILSSDFSKLGEEVKKIERAGADLVHIDVMDGSFVPNITIGAPVVKSLKRQTDLLFDVHLMIENPDKHIDDFVEAGSDIITVHAEATKHLHRTIQKIKQKGVKCGVALNPATPLNELEWIIRDVDMILLMTVNPGFGGQTYIEAVTQKIKVLKNWLIRDKLDIDIEVDGGVTLENIQMISAAGANVFVSGSTIFGSNDVEATIRDLKTLAHKGKK